MQGENRLHVNISGALETIMMFLLENTRLYKQGERKMKEE